MKQVKATVLSLLTNISDKIPRSRRYRHILLDCAHILTTRYLEDFRCVFDGDRRLRFFKLVRKETRERDKCLSGINCRAVSRMVAKLHRWDLVVLADHSADIGNPRRFAVLRIPHGVGGKLVDGHDYFYGGTFDSAGRPRYSCIFEASKTRMDKFVSANPDLRPIVRLVGDLRIDHLVEKSKALDGRNDGAIRPKVVIASSWNPHNLLAKMGIELMAEAERLREHYTFVIRPHPHLYTGTYTRDWKAFLKDQEARGFLISPPDEDLGEVLASASAIVCDDLSSVILYAAALNKRIILVPSGSNQIPADSFATRLAEIVPNLTKPEQFRDTLAKVLNEPPPRALRELAGVINSCPGQAAELIITEVYRLLKLPRPQRMKPAVVKQARRDIAAVPT